MEHDPTTITITRELAQSLASPDDCDRDHNNSCQAHGHYGIADNEKCPQDQLKILIGKSYWCGGK